MSVRYLTPASLSRISFRLRPLCTILINTLLSLAWSRHSFTLPFAFATNTKLLHHSDNSPTSNGTIICCLCNHSSFFLHDEECICYPHRWNLVLVTALPHLQIECALKAPNSCEYLATFAMNFCTVSLLGVLYLSLFVLYLKKVACLDYY